MNVSRKEIKDFEFLLNSDKTNPRDLKRKLARDIVSFFYNDKMASSSEMNFDTIFINKSIPKNIPEFAIPGTLKLVDCIFNSSILQSKSEIKRLIKQGGVRIDDEQIMDIHFVINKKEHKIIKIGKRKFLKIV